MPGPPQFLLGGPPWMGRWDGSQGLIRGPRGTGFQDADALVTNGAPHSVFVSPSSGSGELRWFFQSGNRGFLSLQNFNIADAPSAQFRVTRHASGKTERTYPGGAESKVNTTASHIDVGENPWDTTLSLYVGPTDQTLTWSAVFTTFATVANLAEDQMLVVRMKFNGTYSGPTTGATREFTISALDGLAGDAVIASRTVAARLSDGQEWVVMLKVKVSQFAGSTMAGLKIKVEAQGGTGSTNIYWTCGAIMWHRIAGLLTTEYDSGWVDLVGTAPTTFPTLNFWRMPRTVQSSYAWPYLGETSVIPGAPKGLLAAGASDTRVYFTWDDSKATQVTNGSVLWAGSGHVSTPGAWRPEIGWIDEGEACYVTDTGKDTLGQGYTFQIQDSSTVEATAGDSDMVTRRKVRRVFSGHVKGLTEVQTAELAEWLRRVGKTEPVAIAVKPLSANIIRQPRSFIGRVVSWKDTYVGGSHPGRIDLTVLELL